MTSTVRSVRVVMDADVGAYVAKMKAAGKATDDAFDGIDRRTSGAADGLNRVEKASSEVEKSASGARPAVRGLGEDVDQVGKKSGRAGPEIDRFSGRLGVLRDLGVTIGPALIPLAAGTLPALTAGVVGLGSGLIGLGVGIAALHGVGDGLKALDAYKLDPTIENFRKLQQAEQSLGPAGTEFLHYLDALEPQLKDLQNLARAGFLPGLEDGIDSLITRLPVVRTIVQSVSTELGNLSRDAGASLASDDFSPFFNYLRTDAAPTLDAFARSAGNVGLGLANLLVAFAPATRDFSGGLVDLTSRFADFSKTLDTNDGFQSFLTYVRESGPQVVQLLGGVANAVGGLAKAAAPFGSVVLPALTDLLNLFGKIAGSPIGAPLYTAAAGMIAVSRAAKLAQLGLKTFGTSAETAAVSSGRLGKIGAYSGGILLAAQAIGALVNATLDLGNTVNSADIDRDLTAISSGQTVESLGKLTGALEGVNEAGGGTVNALFAIPSALTGIKTSFATNKNTVEQFDQALASLVESGHAQEAAAAFQQIRDAAAAHGGVSDGDVVKSFDAYNTALKNIKSSGSQAAEGLSEAASAAQQLSASLSELEGFFSRRDAVLAYKDAVDQLSKGLKNGFNRDDLKNLNQVGESLVQVAQQIKDPGRQANFIVKATSQLQEMASGAGPKAQVAIQRVIDKLNDLSGTRSKAEVGADTKAAESAIQNVLGLLGVADRKTANPKVTAQTQQAEAAIHSVLSLLAGVHNVSSTITTTHVVRNVGPTGNPQARADGGEVFGQRHPYGDKVLVHAAPGEEIISNRHGQADQFRADRAAGRIPGYADGGTVKRDLAAARYGRYADGGTVKDPASTKKAPTAPVRNELFDNGVLLNTTAIKALGGASYVAGLSLKQLSRDVDRTNNRVQHALDKQQKALDKASTAVDRETQERDAAASALSDFASSVGSAYSNADLFSGGLSQFDVGTAANTNDTNDATTALATAAGKGLDGALYEALAQSGNLTLIQQFAGLSADQIAQREQSYAALSTAQSTLGTVAANQAGFQTALDQQNAELVQAQGERATLTAAVKDLQATLKALPDSVAAGAKDGTEGKDRSKDRDTAAGVRTQVGTGHVNTYRRRR